jgi:2,4-diketo-3-deoxy-L-fuconate hydrolase
MRLGRLGPVGGEVPVAWQGGDAYDLREVCADIDATFWTTDGPAEVSRRLVADGLPRLDDTAGMRVGAPIARPGAVVCVGLNYAAHAAESGVEPPKQPVIFLKTPNTVAGPDDDVRIPYAATRLTGRSSLASSSGGRRATSCRPTRAWTAWPGSC